MKKRIVFVTLLISALLSLVFYAHAHSGRTDGSGGHYDRQNGGYHFHHGYPEHQHPNGECPYEFDDNTSHNYSSNSNSNNSTKEIESSTVQDPFTREFLELQKDKIENHQEQTKESENKNDIIGRIRDFILDADWEEIFATFFLCFIFVLVITLLVSPYAYGSTTIKSQKSKKFIIAIHVIIIVGIPLVLTILLCR